MKGINNNQSSIIEKLKDFELNIRQIAQDAKDSAYSVKPNVQTAKIPETKKTNQQQEKDSVLEWKIKNIADF